MKRDRSDKAQAEWPESSARYARNGIEETNSKLKGAFRADLALQKADTALDWGVECWVTQREPQHRYHGWPVMRERFLEIAPEPLKAAYGRSLHLLVALINRYQQLSGGALEEYLTEIDVPRFEYWRRAVSGWSWEAWRVVAALTHAPDALQPGKPCFERMPHRERIKILRALFRLCLIRHELRRGDVVPVTRLCMLNALPLDNELHEKWCRLILGDVLEQAEREAAPDYGSWMKPDLVAALERKEGLPTAHHRPWTPEQRLSWLREARDAFESRDMARIESVGEFLRDKQPHSSCWRNTHYPLRRLVDVDLHRAEIVLRGTVKGFLSPYWIAQIQVCLLHQNRDYWKMNMYWVDRLADFLCQHYLGADADTARAWFPYPWANYKAHHDRVRSWIACTNEDREAVDSGFEGLIARWEDGVAQLQTNPDEIAVGKLLSARDTLFEAMLLTDTRRLTRNARRIEAADIRYLNGTRPSDKPAGPLTGQEALYRPDVHWWRFRTSCVA